MERTSNDPSSSAHMERLRLMDGEPGPDSLSRASSTSWGTLLVHSSASSENGSANRDSAHPSMEPPGIHSSSLCVNFLSTTSWRQQYPRIGQFAMTPSEEVVAAGPDGLVYFRRVQDHASRPWSEPLPFPPTKARLDASTVTGLALHRGEDDSLHVHCIADGKTHAFSRPGDLSTPFVVDSCLAFESSEVIGTPAVAKISEEETDYADDDFAWCFIAPCLSGGILYTSTIGAYQRSSQQKWKPVSQIAVHLGIVSAVSVAVIRAKEPPGRRSRFDNATDILAVCIASSRLHSIKGSLNDWKYTWQHPKSTRIQHPGEVTGNPVLLSSKTYTRDYQLDLLVPSAEGGIFHFIQTVQTPGEWHMIGRISFPTGVPIVSSLACLRLWDIRAPGSELRAFVQCGGRFYLMKTTEGASPWWGSQLHQIEGPGPFLH